MFSYIDTLQLKQLFCIKNYFRVEDKTCTFLSFFFAFNPDKRFTIKLAWFGTFHMNGIKQIGLESFYYFDLDFDLFFYCNFSNVERHIQQNSVR